MDFRNIVALIVVTVILVFTFLFVNENKEKRDFNVTRFIARVGIFSAISTILYCVPLFKFSLPIFPAFLELHFDEIPAFICGFAYGPLAGVAVILIKTIIKLPATTSATVGEFCDLILSSSYVAIASLIYQRKRNLKGVFIGFGIATISQIILSILINVFISIPFYETFLGLSDQDLLYLMRLAIPAIKDVRWSYGFIAVLPFNLIKDILVFAFTYLIYRRIHKFLRYEGRTGIKKAD